MSREASQDFELLKEYISSYKIAPNLENPRYVALCKEMHRHYLALLIWSSEAKFGDGKNFLSTIPEELIARIQESISDMGSSLFCWLHGTYKPANIMIRSSIENLIRGIGSIESSEIEKEKNAFKLFELSKSTAIFNKSPSIRSCLNALHGDYATLCADVHTATIENMASISSLADFPRIDITEADNCKNTWVRVSKNLITLLNLSFSEFFHGMHHRNREIILDSIHREMRPLIYSTD